MMTVMYIADIDEKNVEEISKWTLSDSACPIPDKDPMWPKEQAGRQCREYMSWHRDIQHLGWPHTPCRKRNTKLSKTRL